MGAPAQTLKRVALAYGLVLGALGLAFAVLAVVLLASGPTPMVLPQDLLAGAVVIGLLVVAANIVGAVGVRLNRSRSVKVASVLLALVIVGLLAAALAVALKETLAVQQDGTGAVLAELSGAWNRVSDATAVRIQAWGQCCGFYDYGDRAVDPCTKYAPEVGCAEPAAALYMRRVTAMVAPLAVLLGGALVGLLLQAALLRRTWGESSAAAEAKFIGDRQPFDDWHKAVFQ